MNKQIQEWFKQSEYDLGSAKVMFKGKRYIYTIFLCHLSIEKALKGLYCKTIKDNPPKIHNLAYLATKINLTLPEPLEEFLKQLNNLSVPTRYPNELANLLKDYSRSRTSGVLTKTEELLKWLKTLSMKQ